ncbi:MAG: uroporphyrinogen-III C-methyltransferase [Chitinophaga sp.]|uniref:uroporphyrinogen-III C-methyltransferase n=1 Tax=Chitinophaga sp. TaxID=1869181 RepID=UPI001B04B98D|nr:uroporphyrinogen-III C-methyltransferase [Chitinophaga sp.]MBO9727426.1 uroporphyrinogen-III C-methyltransferase [Chitinophaga sp.]
MHVSVPSLSLVGAGPGDPEMITLKAINTIRQANVILYDALVNESLLTYAAPNAIIRFVGKRYGCHTLSQQEINQLIVEMALTHGHVVRLKGGDPFVFGRAVEEIQIAKQHGIRVNVVPGISSAIAVPASQMMPLTCRGTAESFWVITGTTAAGNISGDIALAARSTATVVILMAMSQLEGIMQQFVQCGKSDTPVAIIQNGTTPQQQMVTGTVKDIVWRAQAAGIGNPAIIVVGEVVALSAVLNASMEQLQINDTIHEKR